MIGLRGSLSWPPEFGTSLTSGGEILATDQLPKIPSIPAIHFRVVSKVESDIISLKKELSSAVELLLGVLFGVVTGWHPSNRTFDPHWERPKQVSARENSDATRLHLSTNHLTVVSGETNRILANLTIGTQASGVLFVFGSMTAT